MIKTWTSLKESEHCVSDRPASTQSSTANAGGHIESLCVFHWSRAKTVHRSSASHIHLLFGAARSNTRAPCRKKKTKHIKKTFLGEVYILEDVKLSDGWVVKAEMLQKNSRMTAVTDKSDWCPTPLTSWSEMTKRVKTKPQDFSWVSGGRNFRTARE